MNRLIAASVFGLIVGSGAPLLLADAGQDPPKLESCSCFQANGLHEFGGVFLAAEERRLPRQSDGLREADERENELSLRTRPMNKKFEGTSNMEILFLLAFIAAWFALQTLILPRFGVST